jgi:hypothetical protein
MINVNETNKGGNKMSVPKIYPAIAAIQAEVGNIPKNGIGPASQGSYKYIKNDDILEKISELLVKHNVIVRPRVLDYAITNREIGSSRTTPLTVLTLETTYVSVEDGSEFTVVVSSEGADNGDKAGRKAMTQAQKMTNLLTFSIATGEPDPDGIDGTPSAPAQAQSATAKKIANAKNDEATGIFNEIKAFLGANGLNGSVANSIGSRLSGGKPASEWSADTSVLNNVLKALKAGEVE